MDTLQNLLPILQEQALQWRQFTLERPDYAAVVAISVWLLMAIFYSIRIGFLKKDIVKLNKSNTDTQAALETAQKHGKTLQQQINDINSQMQQISETAKSETRRANDTKQLLEMSNRQLADSLASLVDVFELNMHNLPAVDAENLLTEYQNVVARVAERFRNEQDAKTQLQLSYHAESAKLAEKEMLISSLQHRLDNQTQQLAQMELAIEQYESAQRQLQADKEQLLAQAVARQEAEAARLADRERQQAEAAKAASQAKEQAEAVRVAELEKQKAEVISPAKEPQLIEQPETTVGKEPAKQPETFAELKSETVKSPAPASTVERLTLEQKTSAKEKTVEKKATKARGFFSKAMDRIAKMDEKLGAKPNSDATSNSEGIQVADEDKVVEAKRREEIVSDKPVTEQQAQPKKSEGFSKKLGVFSGFKKTSSNQVAEGTASTIQAQVEVSEAEDSSNSDSEAKSGKKLTGLFGKFKSKK